MTWGHAVSKDLLHWEHLENALEPDDLGTMFSGSAVIDKMNTSGLGSRENPAMVCLYTAAGGTNEASKGKPFTQCLAWSTDGLHFQKYKGNPIIPHYVEENRDPKVFWHSGSKEWVAVTYLTADQFQILGSPNLLDWKELSRFTLKGSSECPDLFALPLDGNKKKSSWVFWGANGTYQVGNFDGVKFVPTTGPRASLFGNTSYAAQTFSNAPNGKCIQISWLRDSNFPNCAWNQQMGFPNVLSLRTTAEGPTLAFNPVDSIKSIRKSKVRPVDGRYDVTSGLFEAEGEWDLPKVGRLSLQINGEPLEFDRVSGKISLLGKEAKLNLESGRLKIRILVDRASIEVYAQDGLTFMPFFVLPRNGVPTGIALGQRYDWKGKLTVYELAP